MGYLSDILDKLPKVEIEELLLLKQRVIQSLDTSRKGILEEQESQLSNCPHCDSVDFIKWGSYKNRHRYKCKKCMKTFLPTTGTAIHWAKKPNEFLDYSVSMLAGNEMSLSEQARRFGISKVTAFDWRHKFLISIGDQAPRFDAETEMDDLWFRYSQKGRKGLKYSRARGRSSHRGDNDYVCKVLVTKQRKGSLDMSLVKIDRLDAASINERLGGKFTPTASLVSDKHPSIGAFAKKQNIPHQTFKASEHAEGEKVHVQTVNNLAQRFDKVVNHCLRGVATKYLQNYANWFVLKEKLKNGTQKTKELITQTLTKNKVWDMFMNIEQLYEQFIRNKSSRTYRCPTVKKRKHQAWNFENAKAGVFI